jgi:predicted lipase
VQDILQQYGASSVVLTGHSLGAALALLDAVYLPLHLPPNTRVRMVGYGMPRVGNQAFANYVDSSCGVTHVNNQKDPIAIVPGRFMGFVHPSGEVHIQDTSGAWVTCPGQDNSSPLCIVGDEPNVLEGNILDHLGPYDDGIYMGLC